MRNTERQWLSCIFVGVLWDDGSLFYKRGYNEFSYDALETERDNERDREGSWDSWTHRAWILRSAYVG